MATTPPTVARIPDALVVAALSQGCERGLRAWAVARSVDADGMGHMSQEELLVRFRALGVRRSSAYRLLGDLVDGGFARATRSKRGNRAVVVLVGAGDLAASLRAGRPGLVVEVPLELLLGRSFRRVLAAACCARHNDKPIARATKRELYGRGASPSSQRRAERDLGAKVVHNLAEHLVRPGIEPHALPAIDGRRTFQRKGKPSTVVVRRPNSTTIPLTVKPDRGHRHSPHQPARGEPTVPRSLAYVFAGEGRAAYRAERAPSASYVADLDETVRVWKVRA